MTETHNLYFAYGSNMLARRLKYRCPCAKKVALKRVESYSLEFSKKSKDGSEKATLVEDKNNCVHGVLFEIKAKLNWNGLDRTEGATVKNRL